MNDKSALQVTQTPKIYPLRFSFHFTFIKNSNNNYNIALGALLLFYELHIDLLSKCDRE